MQGAGWLTSEELRWNDAGNLTTHAPSTYKIPTCSDLAPEFSGQAARKHGQQGRHNLSFESGGRTSAHARPVGIPCNPRCDRNGWPPAARAAGSGHTGGRFARD